MTGQDGDETGKSGLNRRKPGSRLSVYIGSWAVRLPEMNKTLIVVLAAVVLGSAVLPTAALPVDTDTAPQSDQPDAANASVAPGEAFAGAVGVQKQELGGEVEARAYGLSLANARSADGKAKIVANRTQGLDQRLERLQDRQRALTRAHENGSISDGRFRAEMAQVAARLETVDRLANQSHATARSLPEPVRDRHGINVTAIEQLREHARTMAGPDVAELARSIAGPSLDRPMGRPGPWTPPGNVTAGGPGAMNGTVGGQNGAGMGPGNVTDGGQRSGMNATNRTGNAGR